MAFRPQQGRATLCVCVLGTGVAADCPQCKQQGRWVELFGVCRPEGWWLAGRQRGCVSRAVVVPMDTWAEDLPSCQTWYPLGLEGVLHTIPLTDPDAANPGVVNVNWLERLKPAVAPDWLHGGACHSRGSVLTTHTVPPPAVSCRAVLCCYPPPPPHDRS